MLAMVISYVKLEEYLNDLFKTQVPFEHLSWAKSYLSKEPLRSVWGLSYLLTDFYNYIMALSLGCHLLNDQNILYCHRDCILLSGPLTVIV